MAVDHDRTKRVTWTLKAAFAEVGSEPRWLGSANLAAGDLVEASTN